MFYVLYYAWHLGGTWMLCHKLLPICGHVVLWISGHQSHFPRDCRGFRASELFFDPRRLATARQSGCHEVGAANVQASSLSCFKHRNKYIKLQFKSHSCHSILFPFAYKGARIVLQSILWHIFFSLRLQAGLRPLSQKLEGLQTRTRCRMRLSIHSLVCMCLMTVLALFPSLYPSSHFLEILHVCACLLAVVIAGYCNSLFDVCSCFSFGFSCFTFCEVSPLQAPSVLFLLFHCYVAPVFLCVCRLHASSVSPFPVLVAFFWCFLLLLFMCLWCVFPFCFICCASHS